MGYADVAMLLFTDRQGRILARTKGQYCLNYPLGFVDGKAWPYDFLF
jgi:hypothetical protein